MRGLHLCFGTTLAVGTRRARPVCLTVAIACFLLISVTARAAARDPASESGYSGALLGAAFSDLLAGDSKHVLLSDADVERYRQIFAAQAVADWAKADGIMARLEDRRLVGHLLAQRYLHPTAYRATYDELRTWLVHHRDLPGASRIHALALRRQPQGESHPDQPQAVQPGVRVGLPAAATMASADSPAWRSGLTAWQAQDYAQALVHFQQVANSRESSPWQRSAGAYWAARCLARLQRPAEVSAWLTRAASHPRTFYGLIAQHQLGLDIAFNWVVPELTSRHLDALAQYPGGQRALALIQVGQKSLAEAELRRIRPDGYDVLEEALVALSVAANLPNLALRVGTAIAAPDGQLYDAALYPVPEWQPAGGYQIDRALVFALMRQESRFEPTARSRAGATGLMQLMPGTASFVAGRPFDQSNLFELKNPETNLTLGQKYLTHLLDQPEIEGNLFYLLAAYNGGPTQVMRWKRDMGITNDPLLFLETIPAAETRDFAERVLANYWVYQTRLGRDTPALESVVAGDWPMYAPALADSLRVAETGSRPVAPAQH